ncbi:hypothetical protein JW319_22505 [Enterobacter cloacae subsp. cloacae]|uniref:hypothetical protein n=1 Tax=Enterobacter cloacae TaxID=550 RepID=UPI001C5B287A|nr:hypothetical protein [Enterobacter cloacae]MBW4204129.1 hypothetical protein [Enterobacter cloacae subsp. cloacae]
MVKIKPLEKLTATIVLGGCIVLTTGCASKYSSQKSEESKTTELSVKSSDMGNTEKAISDSTHRETERLNNCQKELNILKGVSAEKYTIYKRTFDGLMSGAAQYAGLRKEVNANIQETVDALYRYKVNRLCAEVSQVALEALVERGEQVK